MAFSAGKQNNPAIADGILRCKVLVSFIPPRFAILESDPVTVAIEGKGLVCKEKSCTFAIRKE